MTIPLLIDSSTETFSLLANDDSILLHVSSMVSPDSLLSTEHTIFHAGDWALIELDDSEKHIVNEVTLDATDQSNTLFVQNFARGAPSGRLFAALHNSTVPGVAAGSTCSVKLPGSKTYCRVWPVELDAPSCKALLA